jgi:hypothetical protein
MTDLGYRAQRIDGSPLAPADAHAMMSIVFAPA